MAARCAAGTFDGAISRRSRSIFTRNPQPAELPLPGADYNIAPTTFQPIIRQSRESGERGLVLARWGLVPFFTKELSEIKGLSTITARAESIIKAPTWREPMKKRRCIVPADAFFEWRKVDKPPKQPYAFELANGHPIGFAGLWDAWKDKDGHWLQSFAIVTTEANELMAPIHPRMPVILHARDYYRWLDREETERLPLDLLRPLESEEMEMFEANPRVGNVRNNGPQLMRAAAKSAKHGELPLGRRDGKSNPEHGSLPLQADAAANRDPAAMGSLRAL